MPILRLFNITHCPYGREYFLVCQNNKSLRYIFKTYFTFRVPSLLKNVKKDAINYSKLKVKSQKKTTD